MALSIRRQPGKTLLVALAGTSLLLFFMNQTEISTPISNHFQSAIGYSHRRIQDYSSPEYTAPAETGSGTNNRDADAGDERSRGQQKDETGLKSISFTKIPPPETVGSSSRSTPSEPQPEEKEDNLQLDAEVNSETRDASVAAKETNPSAAMDEAKPSKDEDAKESKDDSPSTGDESDHVTGVAQGKDDIPVEAIKEEDKAKNSATIKPSGNKVDLQEKKEDGAVKEQEDSWVNHLKPDSKESLIESIIDQEREVVAEAMKGYSFHRKLKATKMDDLVPEKGGQPVRSIVITTWRSGSTFIGDVLQSHPATYYHYEPLLDFGINQVRYGEMAKQAIQNLRHLLTCNYTDMDNYLDYGPQHPWLFLHNTRLWHYCTTFPHLCWDPDLLNPFCRLFPFQSLKTVRLRLNLTEEFLHDKSLGVQILLLVRDPRGTMQSRRHREWCPGMPDCEDPAQLCNDLVNDYNTAIDFRRKFPHSFRVVRYEDLSFDAYNMTKELFNFFHLNYHPRVQAFLDTHTKKKIGGVSSTFRDSKTAPVHWQKDLSWKDVESIQQKCSKALKLWGYNIATDENHLRSFKPVGLFKFR